MREDECLMWGGERVESERGSVCVMCVRVQSVVDKAFRFNLSFLFTLPSYLLLLKCFILLKSTSPPSTMESNSTPQTNDLKIDTSRIDAVMRDLEEEALAFAARRRRPKAQSLP